jgi:soluble lytic murein transglycosylase-like protein
VYAVLVLLLFLLPGQCWGFSPDVFTRASSATGIPVELIVAVSHVESGFHPDAINVAGRPFQPSSRYEAEWILRRSGDNVDIGLMQINWGHWGKRFGLSKADLLDPWLNVLLGARILEYCVRVSGSWRKGVALYHSPHEARQREYVEKVWQSYRRVLVKFGK